MLYFYFYFLPMLMCVVSTLIIYLRLKVNNIKVKKETNLNEFYSLVRYLIIICTPLLNIIFAVAVFIIAIIIDNDEFKNIFSD